MTEYTKLKNAELEALLKKRNLPHNGKKAELVARLQEDDQKSGTDAAAAPTAASKNEDEIDWDDDATADAPKPAADAPAEAAPAEPTATETATEATTEPAATGSEAPVAATETTAESNGEAAAPAAPVEEKEPVDYSIGLKEATLDEEIERRKARAKKFGLAENEPAADEALQRLERAKKFGAAETDGPRGLNEALPEHSRKRGRGGEEGGDDARGFKRRGRGGRLGRGGRGGRGPPRDRGDGGRPSNGGGLGEKDRAAAEARKARFAAA